MIDWLNERLVKKLELPKEDEALKGRETPIEISGRHAVLGTPMLPPFPEGCQVLHLGMGCFWGAERKFWSLDGVYTTAVGYGGGFTKNPTYEEVCSGRTGHTEIVLVVFDPEKVSVKKILQVFWESHDPTQGMRQGNDIGTQYRSYIGFDNPQLESDIMISRDSYQTQLTHSGFGNITTEIQQSPDFYYAEEYHQQYLHKNPNGYCGLGGTGVSCPL